MRYDVLGRMLERVDDALGAAPATSVWTYDTPSTQAAGQAGRSIGKLVKVSGGEGDAKSYTYDTYGRPDTTTTWLDTDNDHIQDLGEVYTTSQTYDHASRVDTITYPASAHHAFGLKARHPAVRLLIMRHLTGTGIQWLRHLQFGQFDGGQDFL